MRMRLHLFLTLCLLLIASAVGMTQVSALQTTLTPADLDPAAFTQWMGGQETPMPGVATLGIWTTATIPQWCGVTYGESKAPGLRHLRIGFLQPRPITTVLVRGGGKLSVLKATTVYPGNLNDETQWLPAQRLRARRVTTDEVGVEDYAVWILPPGTVSRALRFTHEAQITDKSYADVLGGAYLPEARFANIAPQAIVLTNTRSEAADRINNESNDGTWSAWDNGKDGAVQPLSAEHPEDIILRWPKAVTLTGLYGLWAGFGAAEVQAFTGAVNPAEAAETDWRTIQRYDKLDSYYPLQLGVNTLAFPQPVTTSALRIRITGVTREGHPHLQGSTKGGKRVWCGELFALQDLGKTPLEQAIMPGFLAEMHPPIPIKFTLAAPGFVTLVLDDAQGKRVRNLLSETFFPAGENTAWWDGMDDLGRDPEAAHHGIYHIPGQLVAPGVYRVRGVYHHGIDLRYEFSLYNAGYPAWMTADNTGGWLTNHTPPSSALFLPADRAPGHKDLVYLGSYVSEGGHGLAWVDLDGHKVGGMGWVGGIWTGAPYLARDAGDTADKNTYVYAGSAWDTELRLTAITASGEKSVLKYQFPDKEHAVLAGLAVQDNNLVASLPRLNKLLFVDVRTGQQLGASDIADPRGVAFDAAKRLLVLSGTQLFRVTFDQATKGKPNTNIESVIKTGLEDPQHVTTDAAGNLYISDRGKSHQVKVFTAAGKFLRAIGHPGVPKAGLYDQLHMQNPNGITIDSQGRLWVAETDFQPKRVSVWSTDGKLVKAYYGPAEYGGGGMLDPVDKTLYYNHGMAFRLDWTAGTDQIIRVFHRPQPEDLKMPDGFGVNGLPETPLYRDGKRYFTNCYNSNPTNGAPIAVIWQEKNGLAVPVAAIGCANLWSVLQGDVYKSRWPAGIDLKGDYWRNLTFFTWSDLNGDGQIQPEELTMRKGAIGGITIAPDLTATIARVDDATMQFVPRLTATGVPVYALENGRVLATEVQGPMSSGGDQALTAGEWTVLTVAPKPYSQMSVCGVRNGTPVWSYPNLWPGLHASHESPPPEQPGELIGVTRLLGGTIMAKDKGVGPLWCVNSNQGCMYLFTMDGLFVSTLFRDVRIGHSWSMPIAKRGMDLTEVTCHDENFWPSITQTADGNVYLIDGGRTSLVRVDGLDTLTRLPDHTLTLTKADLLLVQNYGIQQEIARQRTFGSGTLKVAMRAQAPVVDGKLDEWTGAQWVSIDKRGVPAYFNSDTKPYDVRGAVSVAGDRLYAAFITNDANLLRNAGTVPNALFKTGGALDLMIGANPRANLNRTDPSTGDQRLLVALVDGKVRALLYQAVVPGTTTPVPFSSPWRTVTIDRVDDVSDKVQMVGADGNYELSIPLATLGLTPAEGLLLKGDLGLLRGDSFQTLQRVYWHNKATGITADVPSEAMFMPELWGRWQFVKAE